MAERSRITRRHLIIGGLGTGIAVGMLALKSMGRGQNKDMFSPKSRQGVRIEVASSVSDFAPVPGTVATLLDYDSELPTYYSGDSPLDPPSAGIRFIATQNSRGERIPAFAIDVEGKEEPEIWSQRELKEPIVRVVEENGKAGQWRQLRYEPVGNSRREGIIIIRMQIATQSAAPTPEPTKVPLPILTPVLPASKPPYII